MPKKQKKSKLNNDGDALVSMPFRVTTSAAWPATAGTTVTNYDLNLGNLGARMASLGLAYEFFRIKRMKAAAFSSSAGVTYDTNGTTKVGLVNGLMALGFDPESDLGTGTPTSYTQVAQFGHFSAGNPRHRLVIKLGAKDLYEATPTKWYHTTSTGSIPADQLTAGCFYMVTVTDTSTASMPNMHLVIEGIIQFKGAVTPTLSFSSDGSVKIVSKLKTNDDQKEETGDFVRSNIIARNQVNSKQELGGLERYILVKSQAEV